MLSLFDIKKLLNPVREEDPAEDFKIIQSWAEYEEGTSKAPDKRNLEYMCYELEAMNPETGERTHFYKAIRFARVRRLPDDMKQSTALMDMQEQVLAAVHENQYNMITIIANIIKPVSLGLLFLYGIQGIADNIEDAKQIAREDFIGFVHIMQGTFRVLRLECAKEEESEWLREKMYNMDYLTVVRGIPKASKAGENAGNKAMGAGNLNPDSQGTLEEIITGMVDYEYVIEVLSTPVYLDTLMGWQRQSQKEMSDWYGQLQGQKSLSMSISVPMVYMANSSQASGWSHAYTDASTVSYAQGESFSMGESQSFGEALSNTYGMSVGHTEGSSLTNSFSQGLTQTHGVSFGESFGQNASVSQGINVGHTDGSNFGVSDSYNQGASFGQADSLNSGVSSGYATSENSGLNASLGSSQNTGLSQGQSVNVTEGQSSGSSYNLNYGENSSLSQTQGYNQSVGYNQSENVNMSNSATVGQNFSQSQSMGLSSGSSYGTNSGYGYNSSASAGSSSGVTAGGSNTYNLNAAIFGTGGGTSNSTSTSFSDSVSAQYSNGASYNAGASYSQNLGQSVGASNTYGNSTSLSESYGYGQTYGTSQNYGVNESYSASNGQSLAQGWGVNESSSLSKGLGENISLNNSTGNSQSIGSSESYGYSQNAGETMGLGYSTNIGQNASIGGGSNMGVTSSDNIGQSASASQGASYSQNYGENYSESQSQTLGQSIGQSVSDSTTQSASAGYTQNVSNGQTVTNGSSYTSSNGQSTGTNTGTSGTTSLGSSSSMGLGPSIGYSKSYMWMDQGVKDLLEIMEYQNERIKKALRGQGAFYTYVYIACASMDALSAAQALAKSTWQNEFAMVQPLQVLDLTETEQKHLLYHFAAFSADITREDVFGVEEYKYCTVLLPEEYVAYTHLPRLSEGGIMATAQNIPKFAVPSMLEGEIYMGTVLSAERYSFDNGYNTPYDYRIDESCLMHGFFTGESRSGKTVAAMRFIAELSHVRRSKTGKRLRIVVMDPKQDWRALARYVEPERFRFYSLSNPNFNPVKINPWKVPHGVNPQIWVDGVINIYCRAYGLLERGKQMISEVVYELYMRAGVFGDVKEEKNGDITLDTTREPTADEVSERSANVTFKAIYKSMEQKRDELIGAGKTGNDTKDAYARLIERLSCFGREYSIESKLYGTAEGIGIDEMIGEDDVTILESKGLESTFRNFVFGIICSGFYRWALSNEGGYLSPNQYETVLVVEEANEVFCGSDVAGTGSGKQFGMTGESEFEEMIDQAAGYGLFVLAITQKASNLPSSVIANSGMVFCGKISQEEDVTAVIRKIGREERIDDRDILKWFPRSPIGWFVCRISRTNSFEDMEPVLVHIAKLNVNPPSNQELDDILLRKKAIDLQRSA